MKKAHLERHLMGLCSWTSIPNLDNSLSTKRRCGGADLRITSRVIMSMATSYLMEGSFTASDSILVVSTTIKICE